MADSSVRLSSTLSQPAYAVPKHRSRFLTSDRIIALLLIAPSILAIAIFVYGFIGFTGFASFTKWNSLVPDFTLVGLSNFQKLFDTTRFQIDLRNTVTFTFLFLIFCLSLGLILAVLLDQRIRGEFIFRNIFLFPLAVSYIVTGVIWRWLLNPGSAELGATGVNLLLDKIGLGLLKNGWYTDPEIGIKAVVLAATWQRRNPICKRRAKTLASASSPFHVGDEWRGSPRRTASFFKSGDCYG